jgi:hypothetical protein
MLTCEGDVLKGRNLDELRNEKTASFLIELVCFKVMTKESIT